VAEVEAHSFGQAKIVEALQKCFGASMAGPEPRRSRCRQLVQLIEGQAQGGGAAANMQGAAVSPVFHKADFFDRLGNHHLETGVVTDETPLAQASCDVCLKILPRRKQILILNGREI
jgi:hypothetical protein